MIYFKKAILILTGLALASPIFANSYVIGENLGAACYQEAKSGSNNRAAITICNAALEDGMLKSSDRAATYVNRGIVRSSSGDIKGAIVDYNKALELNPELAEAFANRGTAFMRQSQYTKALEEFNRALLLDPQQAGSIYYNRAILHEHFGNLSKAYLDYVKASELRPNWKRPKVELARFVVKSN